MHAGNTSNFSPTFAGLTLTGNLNMGDNDSLYLGTGNDFRLYHNGSNSYIDNGTGGLYIDTATNMRLRVNNTETALYAVANSYVYLYYNNSTRLRTQSTGTYFYEALGVGVTPNATNGRIDASNDIVAYSSDIRLKNVHGNIPNALDKVCALDGFIYTHNEKANQLGYTETREHSGVSAQALQKVLPQAVQPAPFDHSYKKDGTPYSISGHNYLTVQYERIVPLLIEAIKELNDKVTSMEK